MNYTMKIPYSFNPSMKCLMYVPGSHLKNVISIKCFEANLRNIPPLKCHIYDISMKCPNTCLYCQLYGITPFANGVCLKLIQSTTSMGSNPLLMVDGKVYYSHQRELVQTLC